MIYDLWSIHFIADILAYYFTKMQVQESNLQIRGGQCVVL